VKPKSIEMRTNSFLAALVLIIAIIGINACEETTDQINGGIEGTYVETFSPSTSLITILQDGTGEHEGRAGVTMMDDDQLQVHCFGNGFDTTILLDYYEHNDSIMVCLTGDDFTNEYGHMLGESHMSGGTMGNMMGDIGDGGTEWMHHMSDEHDEGDEHFGGFDMANGTFAYSFRMMGNATMYYLNFHGVKQ
jgi:hypothetical protein